MEPRLPRACAMIVASLLAACAIAPTPAVAQTTLGSAFTYQGEIRDENGLANGSYDLRFTLYNDTVAIAGPICFDNVEVVDGRFTVSVDFGSVQFSGQKRFVEIAVRPDSITGDCSVSLGYTTLSPRQELTVAPYALSAVNAGAALTAVNATFAANATNATTAQSAINASALGGNIPSFYTNASNLTSGTIADTRLSPTVPRLSSTQIFSGANTFNNASNIFVGSGAGLTGLDATNITLGTLADARLSTNIPRLAASQAWTAAQSFTNAGNTFVGGGAGLTGLNASALSSGTVGVSRLPSSVLYSNLPGTVTADYRFTRMSFGTAADPTAELRIASTSLNGISVTQPGTNANGAAIRGDATAGSGPVYGGYFSNASPSGAAVYGTSTAGYGVMGRTTGTFTAGVYGVSNVATSSGVFGAFTSSADGGNGIEAQTASASGAGIYARGLSPAGPSHGVWGVTVSPDGYGVLAANTSTSGISLFASNVATAGSARAIYATVSGDNAVAIDARQGSTSSTGTQIALRATAASTSPDAWSGYFLGKARFDSRVLVGYGSPEAMLHISRASGFDPQPFRIDVDGDTKFTVAQQGQTGIGTSNPNARLHIAGQAGESALRVNVDGNTKLIVRENGGTVIGGLGGAPPDDGLLVNKQVVIRDSAGNRDNDLWIGPNYDFETAHLVVNGDGLDDLLALSNQDASKFRVQQDGATAIGTNSVPPAQGLYVLGNTVIGATFPLPNKKLYVNGNAEVNGNLAKAGGSFKIDHPLDPTNKYLYHSFVESPDMMNVYNGNIVTDSQGFATVELPEWFEVLNRDFRYQLTVIDSGDDDFVFARVYRKIDKNAFVIKTSRPQTEVSWQVTGVRQDPWAEHNRIPVEEDKDADHKGTYLHPEVYEAR